MTLRDHLKAGLTATILGAAVGAILSELAATLLWPAMYPTLALVLLQAGHGALVAAISTAFVRRASGLVEAALIALPAALLCVALTLVSAALVWGAR